MANQELEAEVASNECLLRTLNDSAFVNDRMRLFLEVGFVGNFLSLIVLIILAKRKTTCGR